MPTFFSYLRGPGPREEKMAQDIARSIMEFAGPAGDPWILEGKVFNRDLPLCSIVYNSKTQRVGIFREAIDAKCIHFYVLDRQLDWNARPIAVGYGGSELAIRTADRELKIEFDSLDDAALVSAALTHMLVRGKAGEFRGATTFF